MMPRIENGFVYLWALFAVTLVGIVMAGTGQVWQTKSQREKETELLYIGEQFHNAIMSYYNGGAKQYPDSLEDLLQDNRTPVIKRHLRKLYLDPVTNTTDWGIVVEEPAPAQSSGMSSNINPGIIGVYSLSKKVPIKKDNFPEHFAKFSEALTYQDWQFVYKPKPGNANNTSPQPKATSTPPPSTTASPFSPQSSSNNTGSKAPAPGFPSAK